MKRLSTILAAAAALTFASAASAIQQIRIIVPFPAGGGVDAVARIVSQKLGEIDKNTYLIDNRGGAGGAIGANAVAKSTPNGTTVLVASPAEVVVSKAAGIKLPYEPERDLMPVVLIGETPLAIAAHPSLGVTSLQQLMSSTQKDISYGTPGNGSSMHFAGAMLSLAGKVSLLHVPYKGAAPALNDLLGGQVKLGVMGLPPIISHHNADKVKILAVTTQKRSPALPDVPTVGEVLKLKDYRFSNWMGVFVPAGTPAKEIERLNKGINQALQDPGVRKKLLEGGVEPVGGTTEQFVAFLKEEEERYTTAAKKADIRAD
jgi:tripartite-type tricarboxylate transporter receptor subunit TctC